MLVSSNITKGINGTIAIPGDKSISHRSIMIPSISNGTSEISNLLMSEDVMHTLNAFKAMGVQIDITQDRIIILGKGLNSLKEPKKKIYLGNSGTGARLLSGLLASQNFNSTLSGDKSLSVRPMKRIIEPLNLMGASIKSESGTLPINIFGKELKNINYKITVPSAQVKSGIIFAALNTKGKSIIKEVNITRDHTETMLRSFGANISVEKNSNINKITIEGKIELKSKNISVPSDLSSASFFIVAAIINKNSNIFLKNININSSRDGILRALKIMGAKIKITNKRLVNEELVADINVETSELSGCELDEDMSKLMIDEYPILSVAASFANSPSIFRGLKELRVKESDRLQLIKKNLDTCGVNCKIVNDDLFIYPGKKFNVIQKKIQTNFDHRIAMSFAIMGSAINTDLHIEDSESIKTSFPKFIEIYNKFGGNLKDKIV